MLRFLFPSMGLRILKAQRMGAGFHNFKALLYPSPRLSPVLDYGLKVLYYVLRGEVLNEKSSLSRIQ